MLSNYVGVHRIPLVEHGETAALADLDGAPVLLCVLVAEDVAGPHGAQHSLRDDVLCRDPGLGLYLIISVFGRAKRRRAD